MPEQPNGETPGPIIAAQMLDNLIRLNQNIEKTHRIYEELNASIADLCDYHETYMRGVEILIQQAEEGKMKFNLGDLCKALAEAADEVMPDEDGEEGEDEDEPGGEDPRVRIVR